MSVNPVEAQIQLYAKQLKIPTFADYNEILRRLKPNSIFEDILLELMKSECITTSRESKSTPTKGS